MRRYATVLSPEPNGDGSSVTVPALPGWFTEGDTVEEALEMAKDAIVLDLEGDRAEAWPTPTGVIVAEVDVPIEEVGGVLRPVAAVRA